MDRYSFLKIQIVNRGSMCALNSGRQVRKVPTTFLKTIIGGEIDRHQLDIQQLNFLTDAITAEFGDLVIYPGCSKIVLREHVYDFLRIGTTELTNLSNEDLVSYTLQKLQVLVAMQPESYSEAMLCIQQSLAHRGSIDYDLKARLATTLEQLEIYNGFALKFSNRVREIAAEIARTKSRSGYKIRAVENPNLPTEEGLQKLKAKFDAISVAMANRIRGTEGGAKHLWLTLDALRQDHKLSPEMRAAIENKLVADENEARGKGFEIDFSKTNEISNPPNHLIAADDEMNDEEEFIDEDYVVLDVYGSE